MAARAPRDEFVFVADERAASLFAVASANASLVVVAQRDSPTMAASAGGFRSPWDMMRLSRTMAGLGLDAIYFPSLYTYVPVLGRRPVVVTIHDAIPERFPALTLPSARARLFWALKRSMALRQARIVVTVSEYAANELSAVLGLDRRRVRVVPEAPARVFSPSPDARVVEEGAERHGLAPGSRWFIYVGGIGPHKNVDAIIRAHAALVRGSPDQPVHLLLVGPSAGDVFLQDEASIRALVSREQTSHLVHWLGFVPDAELRHLYTGAIALLLVSKSEGFGLPAVEAAACRTPVVATKASPLPQLLEGGGIFVEPDDESALCGAMRRLASDAALREQLGEGARARASRLNWDTAADAALDAVHEAAVSPRAWAP